MTTELTRPVRRRIGDLVVELREEGIVFRAAGHRRRVTLAYADAVEIAVDGEGYRLVEADPIAQLRRLRKRRQAQARNLFSISRPAQQRTNP